MNNVRQMMIDHIMEHGEAPDSEKILQEAFGKLGGPLGRGQARAGRYAKYVVMAAKPLRPIVRDFDIYKQLGIKMIEWMGPAQPLDMELANMFSKVHNSTIKAEPHKQWRVIREDGDLVLLAGVSVRPQAFAVTDLFIEPSRRGSKTVRQFCRWLKVSADERGWDVVVPVASHRSQLWWKEVFGTKSIEVYCYRGKK